MCKIIGIEQIFLNDHPVQQQQQQQQEQQQLRSSQESARLLACSPCT
jgi:hypothetical protein